MTIPNSFDFTPPEQQDEENLFRNLNEMYEQISTGVNGTKKSSWQTQGFQFTPTLQGSSTPGTFTYLSQTAQVLRVGTVVDYWYEIQWSSNGSASGNLQLNLPYKAILFPQFPFTGTCYPSVINIGSAVGLFLRVNTETFTADVLKYFQNSIVDYLSPPSSGTLSGYLRYLTTEDGGSI